MFCGNLYQYAILKVLSHSVNNCPHSRDLNRILGLTLLKSCTERAPAREIFVKGAKCPE